MQPFISIKTLSGFVAQWAVRQSPYPAPEHLYLVLINFAAYADGFKLPNFPDDWPCLSCTRDDLTIVLDECLLAQEAVQRWNERKNGRQGYGIVSRYGGPKDPDDDFIDLDALRTNIIREALKHQREEEIAVASIATRVKRRFMRWIRGPR